MIHLPIVPGSDDLSRVAGQDDSQHTIQEVQTSSRDETSVQVVVGSPPTHCDDIT